MVTKAACATLIINTLLFCKRFTMKDCKKTEDFLSNPGFVHYVYGTDENEEKKWQEWLILHPEAAKPAKEAAQILQLIKLREDQVTDIQIQEATKRLTEAMETPSAGGNTPSVGRRIRMWSAAAAVILLLLVAGIFFYSDKGQTPAAIATEFGEVRTQHLPDGTEIVLNANSSVRLGKNWEDGQTREVWIRGEVFFRVKKTASRDKFIVHTDAFDIEVTGTAFNVVNDGEKSSIILREGSVIIHQDGKQLLMKPGDFIEYAHSKMQQKQVDKDDYMAWMENKLVFDKTPLAEVAKTIRNHYGVQVILDGPGTEAETISGIMPNDNLEILLSSLEATQKFSIEKTSSSITISVKSIHKP